MLLANYVGKNVTIFKCPADRRTGVYQGTDPAHAGETVDAARTFSMNQAVGTICPAYDTGSGHSGKPTLSVNGPWLNNFRNHKRGRPFRTYGKTSDMTRPGPVNTWVIIDEDAYSVNDASFGVGMLNAEWIDWPGTYHNNAAGIAFADGHSEIHKWVDSRTKVVNGFVGRKAVPGSEDWTWLSEHTSSR
jgi:prepilin-type processing-associated H-X9-DG protein